MAQANDMVDVALELRTVQSSETVAVTVKALPQFAAAEISGHKKPKIATVAPRTQTLAPFRRPAPLVITHTHFPLVRECDQIRLQSTAAT